MDLQSINIMYFTQSNCEDVIHDIDLLPNLQNIIFESGERIYWEGINQLLSNDSNYNIIIECKNNTIDFTESANAVNLNRITIMGDENSESSKIYEGLCNLPNLTSVKISRISTSGFEKLRNAVNLSSIEFENMYIEDLSIVNNCSNVNEVSLDKSTVGKTSSSLEKIDSLSIYASNKQNVLILQN